MQERIEIIVLCVLSTFSLTTTTATTSGLLLVFPVFLLLSPLIIISPLFCAAFVFLRHIYNFHRFGKIRPLLPMHKRCSISHSYLCVSLFFLNLCDIAHELDEFKDRKLESRSHSFACILSRNNTANTNTLHQVGVWCRSCCAQTSQKHYPNPERIYI